MPDPITPTTTKLDIVDTTVNGLLNFFSTGISGRSNQKVAESNLKTQQSATEAAKALAEAQLAMQSQKDAKTEESSNTTTIIVAAIVVIVGFVIFKKMKIKL